MSSYILHLDKGQDETAKQLVDNLKELLGGVGFHIYYLEEDSTLHVNVVTRTVKKRLSRNAGRKKGKVYTQYKCGEIADMQKTMTNEQIATQLNIPKATFYRHLKLMKQHNDMSRLF
jgi:predicted HTH transcriptional regulator